MLFEWDEAKSRRTYRERGFGFDYAVRIFDGLTLENRDNRRDYGEVRIQAIGRVERQILFVVYTDRVDAAISSRRGWLIERNASYGTRSQNA
jgi:uncharacterized DUF497 family protein